MSVSARKSGLPVAAHPQHNSDSIMVTCFICSHPGQSVTVQISTVKWQERGVTDPKERDSGMSKEMSTMSRGAIQPSAAEESVRRRMEVAACLQARSQLASK